jgi:hypothetical protein
MTTVEEVLAQGVWGSKLDTATGRIYYFNKRTLHTTWDLAKELGLPQPVKQPAPAPEAQQAQQQRAQQQQGGGPAQGGGVHISYADMRSPRGGDKGASGDAAAQSSPRHRRSFSAGVSGGRSTSSPTAAGSPTSPGAPGARGFSSAAGIPAGAVGADAVIPSRQIQKYLRRRGGVAADIIYSGYVFVDQFGAMRGGEDEETTTPGSPSKSATASASASNSASTSAAAQNALRLYRLAQLDDHAARTPDVVGDSAKHRGGAHVAVCMERLVAVVGRAAFLTVERNGAVTLYWMRTENTAGSDVDAINCAPAMRVQATTDLRAVHFRERGYVVLYVKGAALTSNFDGAVPPWAARGGGATAVDGQVDAAMHRTMRDTVPVSLSLLRNDDDNRGAAAYDRRMTHRAQWAVRRARLLARDPMKVLRSSGTSAAPHLEAELRKVAAVLRELTFSERVDARASAYVPAFASEDLLRFYHCEERRRLVERALGLLSALSSVAPPATTGIRYQVDPPPRRPQRPLQRPDGTPSVAVFSDLEDAEEAEADVAVEKMRQAERAANRPLPPVARGNEHDPDVMVDRLRYELELLRGDMDEDEAHSRRTGRPLVPSAGRVHTRLGLTADRVKYGGGRTTVTDGEVSAFLDSVLPVPGSSAAGRAFGATARTGPGAAPPPPAAALHLSLLEWMRLATRAALEHRPELIASAAALLQERMDDALTRRSLDALKAERERAAALEETRALRERVTQLEAAHRHAQLRLETSERLFQTAAQRQLTQNAKVRGIELQQHRLATQYHALVSELDAAEEVAAMGRIHDAATSAVMGVPAVAAAIAGVPLDPTDATPHMPGAGPERALLSQQRARAAVTMGDDQSLASFYNAAPASYYPPQPDHGAVQSLGTATPYTPGGLSLGGGGPGAYSAYDLGHNVPSVASPHTSVYPSTDADQFKVPRVY